MYKKKKRGTDYVIPEEDACVSVGWGGGGGGGFGW